MQYCFKEHNVSVAHVSLAALLCDVLYRARFLFWDFIHPSHMATGKIFDLAWSGTIQNVRPMNLRTMLARKRIPFKK